MPQTILVGLKVAYGDLKHTLLPAPFFLCIQIPILFYIASFYSMWIFGSAWLALKTIFFFWSGPI